MEPLVSHDHDAVGERRTTNRRTLRVPLRMTTRERLPQTIDGETIDVSDTGLGVRFAGGGSQAKLDTLLESLVEDRLTVEIRLRLPEGSLSSEGCVMWWGLLGEEDKLGIRAGILLTRVWTAADWQLIEKNVSTG